MLPAMGPPSSAWPAQGCLYCACHVFRLLTIACKVGQETCFNVPTLEPNTVQVEITLPEPVQRCQRRWVLMVINDQ